MGGSAVPSLRAHFGLDPSATGLITSAFPLGMFPAVFMFPALSDVIGRRVVLIASYMGVGLGFCLQSMAISAGCSFRTFVALRVLSGTLAGASVVAKAYIADRSTRDELPVWMAYREAAATLAYIIGPTLGGLALHVLGLPRLVLLQGIASMSAGLMVVFLREELLADDGDRHLAQVPSLSTVRSSVSSLFFGQWGVLVATLLVSCSYSTGIAFFEGFFPVIGVERFGLSAPAVGASLTLQAMVVFFVSTVVYRRVLGYIGLVSTAVLGLACLSVGIAAFGFSLSPSLAVVAGVVYAIGIPLFTPCVPTLLTSCAPTSRRGLVLGVGAAINTLGRIVAPVAFGFVYTRSPALSWSLGGLTVAIGAAVLLSAR
eukprot:CAMPEP_0194538726 /NCGR_PEP_ID=MMETSP0253-20130528/78379_1 /TAXON_ID=2966 /ORGANISM="Noctiluca scintillans" /LENGTH=371 /DNA_ID=CAMNT_0039384893 /DNA_START=218 /DNA_END=1329 /DNA_ORIENTATION=-